MAGESFEKDAIKIFCTLFLLFGLFYLPAIYYTLITAQHRMDEGKIMNMVPLDLTQPTMINNIKEFLESFPVLYTKTHLIVSYLFYTVLEKIPEILLCCLA